MADKQDYSQITGGLDMSKLPLYGQDDERMKELRDAQEKAIQALQQRYEQPNWWKVAAGFAKPQLGGFLASLGSASEAMGENLEQKRAQELPIAQMKLALSQSNMLLGANKKVADAVKTWRDSHPGQTPSAQLVGEWEAMAPNSNVVKSLKDEMNFQQTQQNQNIQRVQEKAKNNMPLSEADKQVLNQNPEGERINQNFPPPSGGGQENKSKNIYITPEGTRVGEDVYKDFYKNGKPTIPIISNYRTQEEQDSLRDHQDANGNWYTKEGNPIAKNLGKHGSGDALDIDSKKLTDDQRKLLESKGWYQPDWAKDPKNPQYDPNHWERTSAQSNQQQVNQQQPTQKTKFYGHSVPKPDTAGMGNDDRRIAMENYGINAKATEAPYQEKVASLQPVVTGPDYTRIKNSYDTAIGMIENNPTLAKTVFAMMRQDPIAAALNEGFGVHAGAFNANVSLPIQAFLDAGLGEKEKNYADKLFSSLMNITMANLRAQGVTMGKVPQQEYMKALSGFVNPNMTAPAALNGLHHARADFDYSKDYYDTIQKERREKVDPTSATPYADIHNSSDELAKLQKKYASIKKEYDRQYNDRLKAKQNPPQ